MFQDYYNQYRRTFFGEHIAKQYSNANYEAKEKARAEAVKRAMLRGGQSSDSDEESTSDEDETDEEGNPPDGSMAREEEGKVAEPDGKGQDEFKYRAGRPPEMPPGIDFAPVEMHPEGYVLFFVYHGLKE